LVGGVNAGGRDTAEDTFSAYTAQVAGGGGATIVADSGTYAVSGQDAILDYDRIIPSEAGTYTLGGQIAALDVTKVITSDYGIYTQTGQDASLVETNVYTLDANHTNYLIDANAQAYFVIAKQLLSEQGSYVLDGQVANLVTSKLITSEQGTYSLDGQSAFLDETNVYYLDASHALYLLDTNAQAYFNLSRQVIAGQGDYSVSGQVASLITSRAIASAQGNYTITGHTVSLDTEADFPLGQGSYALNTSFELYLVVDRIVTMAQGTYTSFGNAVYFLRDLTRTFDQGTYGITGNDASLNIILAYFLQASHGLYLGDYNSQISFDLDRILTASKGDYLLTGQSSSFIRTLIEELETGNYLVEGNQISLGISGVGTPYYFFLFAHRN
jgi:hypothetical protein